MKLQYLICLSVLLFATACSSSETSRNDKHNHHHESKSEFSSLNNGQKWKLDAHTRNSLSDMQKIVSEKSQPIGANLKNEIQALIQGCKMTGKEHDQLHKYLVVLIPAIEDLSSQYSDEKYNTVNDLLIMYPTYFE